MKTSLWLLWREPRKGQISSNVRELSSREDEKEEAIRIEEEPIHSVLGPLRSQPVI